MKHLFYLFTIILLGLTASPGLHAEITEECAEYESVLNDILVAGNINSTAIADVNGNVDCNIIVLSGATFTVTETLRMAANRSISVEIGGRLFVDGGTITAQSEGNNQINRWGGIFAEGTLDAPQNIANQSIVLIDSGEIKYARTGLATRRFGGGGTEGTGGAIIRCINSRFTNNGRGIEFLETGVANNLSFVVDCKFMLTEDYLATGGGFIAHITSFRNRGLLIRRNLFQIAPALNEVSNFDDNQGVILSRTGAVLEDNVFANHDLGLSWKNRVNETDTPIVLTDNVFKRGARGASLTEAAEITAIDNTFYVSRGEGTYGMLVNDSPDFRIEDNLFQGVRIGTGLIVRNSGDNNNTVRNNNFIRLANAIDARGRNRGVVQGLTIACNDFLSNVTDIRITPIDALFQGIRPLQTSNGNAGIGNTFNQSDVNINNGGTFFEYRHFGAAPATIIGNVGLQVTANQPQCGNDDDESASEDVNKKLAVRGATGNTKLYPNPTNGWLNVALPDDFQDQNGKVKELILTSASGRRISPSYTVSATGGLEVDLSAYPTGAYHVALITQTGVVNIGKIVRQ